MRFAAGTLKFYYSTLLGLSARPQVEGALDPAGIGDLVHDVLKEMDAEHCGQRLMPATEGELDRAKRPPKFTGR